MDNVYAIRIIINGKPYWYNPHGSSKKIDGKSMSAISDIPKLIKAADLKSAIDRVKWHNPSTLGGKHVAQHGFKPKEWPNMQKYHHLYDSAEVIEYEFVVGKKTKIV